MNLSRHSHSSHYSHRFSWQLHKLGEVVVVKQIGLAKVARQVCAEDLSASIFTSFFTSLGEGKQKARTVSRSRLN